MEDGTHDIRQATRGGRRLSAQRAAPLAAVLIAAALLVRMPPARGQGQPHIELATDDHAKFQYQQSATVHMNSGQTSNATVVPIPVGTRWVIEYVSIHGTLPAGQSFVPHINFRVLDTPVPFLQHNLNAGIRGTFRNPPVSFWHDSEPVRIYADASASSVLGGGLLVQAERSPNTGIADISYTLSGYLAPIP